MNAGHYPSSALRAPLRVAAAQSTPVPGDVGANAAHAARLVRAARADVVVLPELWLTGYEPDMIAAEPGRCAVTGNDARLAPLADACRDSATVAVVGAAVRTGDGPVISALVLDRSGTVRGRYDKQFLFAHEQRDFRPGAAGCSVDVDGWRLGLGICYDSAFPEHAGAAAADGCDAYLVGGMFGVGNGLRELSTWFPARARENACYAVLANHVGATGGWTACGASGIWAPDGGQVGQASAVDEDVVTVTLAPAGAGGPVDRAPVTSQVPRIQLKVS